MNLKSVKDRLKDDKLDLSFCDLEDVPVKEIAPVRKASHLDLSNNLLVSLPTTFVTLKQIVKLDLSKNMLTEIPENFGEMKQLKYLDLYANQISRLPLGLSELKNLKWLDLKENPLTPAVASVAGPCSNSGECQACARNIVAYLSNVKLSIEEEKLRRLNAAADKDVDAAPTKKEGKKKKKKNNAEKEGKKTADKQKSKPNKTLQENESGPAVPASVANHSYVDKEDEYKDIPQGSSCETFLTVITWAILILCTLAFTVILLPLYYKQESDLLMDYVESRTGVSVRMIHQQGTEILRISMQLTIAWVRALYESISETINARLNDGAPVKTSIR